VRHSGASRCIVDIGPSTLSVIDDGPGPDGRGTTVRVEL